MPWAGNLKALRYLTIGEPIGFLTAKLSATQVRTIMRSAKAAYQLCPPDPARTVMQSANGKAFRLVVDGSGKAIAPMRTTSWMPTANASVQELAAQADVLLGARTPVLNTSVPITNVCGWGLPTETTSTIDGSAVTFEATDQGDGTVAYVSSSWLRGTNVRTLSLPIGVTVTDQIPDPHSQLWNAEAVRQILNEVLQNGQRGPFIHAAVDNDDSLDPKADVRIRIAASTELGELLPNAHAVLHLSSKKEQTIAMPETRLTVKVKRGPGTSANFGSRFFRFRVDVKWDGGAKEMPLMIRV